MKITFFKNTLIILLSLCFSSGCMAREKNSKTGSRSAAPAAIPVTGAEQFEKYKLLLAGKKTGIIANQTSFLENQQIHLVDFLLQNNIDVKAVFAPEHGFRGTADAGEHISDGVDSRTGLPVISLYGANKKPSGKQLENIDILVFDLQDVGVRFYTYISTLHYVMEAAAENKIPLIILDRPNPNGHYTDGPVLEPKHKSFVGMHPVPVVHGMTIGEYAQMINGEGWLENKITCELTVIPVENYDRQKPYSLPVKPSPNLPNDKAINLYPSLCFFEGTPVSEGRGTSMQFQVFGSPLLPAEEFSFSFTPRPNEGAASPKFNGKLCYGKDLRNEENLSKINLEWLIAAYQAYPDKTGFFTSFFVKLAGTHQLQQQIENGMTAEAIRKTWKKDLESFEKTRKKYLIYP